MKKAMSCLMLCFWVVFPIKKLRCSRRSEILNLNPIIWIFLQVLTLSVIPQLQCPQSTGPQITWFEMYSWDESFVNLVLWGCDQMLAVHWGRFDSNFVNARNYASVAKVICYWGHRVVIRLWCDSTVMWFGVNGSRLQTIVEALWSSFSILS